MKYYLAIAKSHIPYIIMESSGLYRWFYQLPSDLDIIQFDRDVDEQDTTEEWLTKLDSYGMQLLASFDDYDIFKRDFPEYFI